MVLWKRNLIRAKRVIRITFMVLICGLLGLILWGPFSYEPVLRWLPLPVLLNLSLWTKSISQVATIHVVHLGIIGYAFHRLPKKNQYATDTNRAKKRRKIAAIVVSALFILAEAGASFAIGGFLFEQKTFVTYSVREKMRSDLGLTSPASGVAGAMNSQPNNTTLWLYAHQQYKCCGIESEPNCSFAHQPTSMCYEGSPSCSNGCLDMIMQRNVFPYMHTVASVSFIVGGFAMIELLIELRKIIKTQIRG